MLIERLDSESAKALTEAFWTVVNAYFPTKDCVKELVIDGLDPKIELKASHLECIGEASLSCKRFAIKRV